MPTLIVHGDADSRTPVACAYRMHQGIPGSELHIIPGAEPGLMTNGAPRIRALILQFLQRHSPAIAIRRMERLDPKPKPRWELHGQWD